MKKEYLAVVNWLCHYRHEHCRLSALLDGELRTLGDMFSVVNTGSHSELRGRQSVIDRVLVRCVLELAPIHGPDEDLETL